MQQLYSCCRTQIFAVRTEQVVATGDVQERTILAVGGHPRRLALAPCGEPMEEVGGILNRIGVADGQVGHQRPSLGDRDAGHEALGRRFLADGGGWGMDGGRSSTQVPPDSAAS